MMKFVSFTTCNTIFYLFFVFHSFHCFRQYFLFREAIEMVEQLKRTRQDLEAKSGNYKPDELYSLLQVSLQIPNRQQHLRFLVLKHNNHFYTLLLDKLVIKLEFFFRYQVLKQSKTAIKLLMIFWKVMLRSQTLTRSQRSFWYEYSLNISENINIKTH